MPSFRKTSEIGSVMLVAALVVACASSDRTLDEETDAGDPQASDAATDAMPPRRPLECRSPARVLQRGTEAPSGFVRCLNGLVERTSSEPVAQADFGAKPCSEDDDSSLSCDRHSDCGELAVCTVGIDGGNERVCVCSPACRSDADCDEREACLPPPLADELQTGRTNARCIPAECRTSADCGRGLCVLQVFTNNACGSSRAALSCMDESSTSTCTSANGCEPDLGECN